jgi:hypothetical protein
MDLMKFWQLFTATQAERQNQVEPIKNPARYRNCPGILLLHTQLLGAVAHPKMLMMEGLPC